VAAAHRRPSWLQDAEDVDTAVYAAVAATPTPTLDRLMGGLARATDHSRLWMGIAAGLAATRGPRGRAAARTGLVSIAAAATVVNAVAKPLARRARPDRERHGVPLARHVPMPVSRSLPSGHAASAFAFATGVAHVLPREAVALHGLAALVGYSRVHTGVHFPGDVVAGALLGTSTAQLTSHALDRRGRLPAT
jgi:undecaprenyl-diphosphatase